MSVSDIRQVEDHYLRMAKWPWNKVQNSNVRTHPEWRFRLAADDVCMLGHVCDYEQDTRRKQGLAGLGIQQVDGLRHQSSESQSIMTVDAAGSAELNSDLAFADDSNDILTDDESNQSE